MLRRQPAPGRAQVRRARTARRDDAAGLLVGVRRTRSTTTTSPPSSCTSWPSGPQRRGLRIAYEALAWGRFVNTYAHAWRIVRRADHPALGLCLDSFHVLSRGDDPAGIRVIPGDKVFHVQLADAPAADMDVLEWSRHHRLFPGLGSFDLAGFVGHVLTTGYAGPLSLEVFNDVYRQADPRHAAIDGMRSLLALQERSTRLAARERLHPATARARPGHVFTELAVDESPGPVVARTLDRARLRPHRPAPLQAGAAVGAGRRADPAELRPAARRSTPGTAAICALAVESADPAGVGPAGGTAARAGAAPAAAARGGRAELGRRARRHRRLLLPHRRRAGRLARRTSCRPGDGTPATCSPAPTTSR